MIGPDTGLRAQKSTKGRKGLARLKKRVVTDEIGWIYPLGENQSYQVKNDLKSLLPFFFLWPFLFNNLSDFLQEKERSVSVFGVCYGLKVIFFKKYSNAKPEFLFQLNTFHQESPTPPPPMSVPDSSLPKKSVRAWNGAQLIGCLWVLYKPLVHSLTL